MTSSNEYMECVSDLMESEEVKRLDLFSQHFNTSRLEHCVSVSYYSYRICKRLGWDYRSAARAGLLHDLYLYDWRTEKQPEGAHAFAHPKVALRNAKTITSLNLIEADAIEKHMWPITIRFPKYRESYAVTFADKLCAIHEFASQTGEFIRRLLEPTAV